ncbi:LysE family translocator [Porticoccus sp. W117]|uniref:LysE family translocator n=1 Tax=Porticoccus sp. W117 TaxID=3054777 RepID=UPI0025997E76|nr:LysE family translocator [Porticoccus sp. W117]MDM3870411.1 LysE family translocator [Porticoccus sp. W117]
MFEWANLSIFLATAVVLTIAPGPDLVFLATQSIGNGPRAGFATAMGLSAGNLVHTLAAALGVSVIFQTSAAAFTALKIAGAVYLLYLAYKAFRAVPSDDASETAPEVASGRSLFWRGVLMNTLNPKVALFFLAFLPQFTIASAPEPIWQQMLVLGLLFTLQVVVVFGSAGLFAGAISQRFRGKGSGKFGRYANKVVGVVFVGLAVRLLLVEK